MILFDTETTGLPGPLAMPLAKQPHIIELAIVKLDDKQLKEVGYFHKLINPGFQISDEITRITGITNEMLKDQPPFGVHLNELIDFFIGERVVVAHNCDFDCKLLAFELMRLAREHQFPWPPQRICTVEKSLYLKKRRIKLSELYEHCSGEPLKGAHRALSDTRGLAVCTRWLRKEKKL